MKTRLTVLSVMVALCLSPLSAFPLPVRPAASARGAGWRAARLAEPSRLASMPRMPRLARGGVAGARTVDVASQVSVPDGAGGLYTAWADFRDGSSDVFLLRVTNAGAVSPGWPLDGVAVCSAGGDQFDPILIPDGSNGVIVGWLDFRDTWKVPDAYAQRVNSAGAAQWTSNGVKVVPALDNYEASAAADGTGGLLVAWSKPNGVDRDVYATRRTGTGALATGWTANGDLVCGLAEDQKFPVVTTDGAAGAIIAWEDARAGGGETHIYAQRLNATAAAQWGTDGMQLDASTFGASSPSICSDGGTGAMIFWDDFNHTPEWVLGQHLNAAGTNQWTAGGLGVPGSDASEGQLGCVADGLGGAMVAWQESPGSVTSIRAQRVNSAGAAQWGTSGVSVVSVANSYPQLGDVVPDPTGAAYFVWEDSRNFGTPYSTPDIFVQRITSVGGVSWTPGGLAASQAAWEQARPTGALDGSGGLLVAWEDTRSLDTEIYAQRFNSAGTAQFATDGKAVFSNPGVQLGPGIIQTAQGGAFLFGQEKRNGQWDIKSRKFNADGTPAANPVAICFAAGPQFLTSWIDDGSGGAIVSWIDLRGGGFDIYAQRVDGNGNPLWTTDGVPVCVASGDQFPGAMVSDGAGGAILTWEDNSDIYAQRISSGGIAQWTTNGVPVCNDGGTQWGAMIASDGAGGAIIAWTDLRSFIAPAVYAQRLDASGTGQWTANGENVATFSTLSSVRVSDAIPAPGNAAIILINQAVFDLVTGASTSVLHVQLVDGSGAEQWGTSGTTLCDAGSRCLEERIVDDGAGGAYVAWSDGRNDVYDIYARRVDATGVAQWATDGVAVCDATGWQDLGSITRHSGGDLVLAWEDQRAGQANIYAHRINSLGAAVWSANGLPVCTATRGQYFAALAPYKSAAPERFFVGWTDNRAATGRYVWWQRLDASGNAVYAADGVTRTTLALVSASAEPDRVRLQWYASEDVATTVYRRQADQEWLPVGQARSDGTGQIAFEDREVLPGARYGYRLGFIDGGAEVFAGEVWVEIPTGLRLALGGLQPNPAADELMVSFTLPSEDAATLELLDVSGRLVRARQLTGLPAGRHTVRMEGVPPPAGIYFLRLTQNGHSITARAAVVR